jgi:hypothetical protein
MWRSQALWRSNGNGKSGTSRIFRVRWRVFKGAAPDAVEGIPAFERLHAVEDSLTVEQGVAPVKIYWDLLTHRQHKTDREPQWVEIAAVLDEDMPYVYLHSHSERATSRHEVDADTRLDGEIRAAATMPSTQQDLHERVRSEWEANAAHIGWNSRAQEVIEPHLPHPRSVAEIEVCARIARRVHFVIDEIVVRAEGRVVVKSRRLRTGPGCSEHRARQEKYRDSELSRDPRVLLLKGHLALKKGTARRLPGWIPCQQSFQSSSVTFTAPKRVFPTRQQANLGHRAYPYWRSLAKSWIPLAKTRDESSADG